MTPSFPALVSSEPEQVVRAALAALHTPLGAFVRARLPASETEEVLQRAATKAIERASSLNDPGRVKAWLYRIHRNAIVDHRRAQKPLTQTDPADLAAPADEVNAVCACSLHLAAALPKSLSSVLLSVDADGATLAEVAATLNITANNASVRLHRARKALRTQLEEHCGLTSVADGHNCECTHSCCEE
jgi:DNA-directed RNA polymerase specialized sigma24 family protein